MSRQGSLLVFTFWLQKIEIKNVTNIGGCIRKKIKLQWVDIWDRVVRVNLSGKVVFITALET